MKAIVFCSNVMTEFGFKENIKTVQLFIDNTSTLFVITTRSNRIQNARKKHVTLRLFYFCEPAGDGRAKSTTYPLETNSPTLELSTSKIHRIRDVRA